MLYAVVILCLVQSVTSNYSKVALDVYDCFTRTADVDWRYSEEESWRVTRFLNYTKNTCEERHWRVFECYYPFLEASYKVNGLISQANELLLHYKATQDVNDLETNIKLLQQGVESGIRLINQMEETIHVAMANNELRILKDNCSKINLEFETWKVDNEQNLKAVYRHNFKLQSLLHGKKSTMEILQQQYQDVKSNNFSKSALDIFECFKHTVDVDWWFSEKETWRIYRFLKYTHSTCNVRYWRVFECYYPLLPDYYQQKYAVKLGNIQAKLYNTSKAVNDFKMAVATHQDGVEALGRNIHCIESIMDIGKANKETRILNDNCSTRLFDLEAMKSLFIRSNRAVNVQQIQLQWVTIHAYYMPPVYITVFAFGLIGNILLLFIFWKQPDVRKGPNLILASLAVSDIFLITTQIVFEWTYRYWRFEIGFTGCSMFSFISTTSVASSVYATTALSIVRFTATRIGPNDRCRKLLTSTHIMIGVVWVLASLVAIPNTISTTRRCLFEISLVHSIIAFFTMCILPLIAIACFYALASKRLLKSAQNMPGEAIGHARAKSARERGARILPALVALFAVTYVPWHLYCVVMSATGMLSHESLTADMISIVINILITFNSALNPVALYVGSCTFRQYFNKYLFKAVFAKCKRTSTPAGGAPA